MSTSTTYSFGSSILPCKSVWENVQPYAKEEMDNVVDEKGDCDPDTLLQCPFDKNHQIRASRFPYHLIKCKKNHPKLASELKTCPFNARHLIPRHEMTRHTATCVDRKPVISDEPSNSDGKCKWQAPVSTWTNPHTDEDWEKEVDDDAVPFVWGTSSSTAVLQPEVTDGFTHELNLSTGLRAPRTFPWPVNWS